jgi:hypothetical protein
MISGDIAMSEAKSTNDFLETLAKILLRCWIFGFVLLLFWGGFFVLAPNVIYDLHGSMFGLSPHELNIIHYCGMGLTKLVVICLFFFPWAAIRLVLKKR